MLKAIEKAAVLLRHIGDDNLQNILKLLKKEDASKLMVILEQMDKVPPEASREVLREVLSRVGSDEPAANSRLVAEKANRYLKMIEEEEEEEDDEVQLLEFLQKADYKQLIELIKNEHPQAIAFILSYIPPEISSQIIPLLSPEVQVNVALRIATMGTPQKEMIKHLHKMLGNKIKMLTRRTMQIGGVESLVKILKGAGRNSEKIILENFFEHKPELAMEIKNLMLVFEDLVLLDDMSIQKILREIDMKILAKSLKKTSPEITDLIVRNLSERARNILQEEIDGLVKIPIKEVEKAQQLVIDVVRRQEEKGEITIAREKSELV